MAEHKETKERTYKHLSGEEHPDNKPPVTIVAKVSDEETKKIEDATNAQIQAEIKATKATQTEQQKEDASAKVEEENLEDHTIPELKAIAEEKGIHVSWDANKNDIIKAIKKAK